MSIATELDSIYTSLNEVLNDCNDSLQSKGVETALNLKDISNKIDDIQLGGGGETENPVIPGDHNLYIIKMVNGLLTPVLYCNIEPGEVVSLPNGENVVECNQHTRDWCPSLTFQEWSSNFPIENNTIEIPEDISGDVYVGAVYVPTDGCTHLIVDFTQASHPDQFDISLNYNSSNLEYIDWGDSSNQDTSTNHTYTNRAIYEIKVKLKKSYNIIGSICNYSMHMYSKLVSVFLDTMCNKVNNSVFKDFCRLQRVIIPNTVTYLGQTAFATCYSLQSIVIPNSVISIGDNTFHQCYSLQLIVIPNEITEIVNYMFYSCWSLCSIAFSDKITSIGSYAFSNCNSLQSIIIPNSVTDIGISALQFCHSLQSIVIPDSVTVIRDKAFYYCINLKEFHFKSIDPPTLESTNVISVASDLKIYVPAESIDAYKEATNWSTYKDYIFAEEE